MGEQHMMEINGVYIVQRGQEYALYTPQGLQIALIWMGNDGQLAHDVKTLIPICKALSGRWAISKRTNQNS